MLCACEKDPTFAIRSINDNATKVSSITTTSAEVIVSIFETESGDHYNYNHNTLEVYYSTSSNPLIEPHKCVRETLRYEGTYTVRLSNLEPGTTYYYAPKLGNQKGKVRSFKTPLELTVTTGAYSNLTAKSVQLEGSAVILNGGYLDELGILVRLHNPDVTIDNYDYKEYSYFGKSSGTYPVTKSFSGLYTESTYYYRTYAKGKNGKIYYGEVKSFKTLPYANIGVTTNYSENVTSTSARVRGYCTLNNGAQLAEAGILLKLHDSNVSLTNYDLYWYGTYTNFYVDFKGLYSNSTYYYRAYAKDKEGNVYYGEVKSFKTLY
ncbi:MAG: fibronectin type III domain-containing protein [Paludibacteraceae bacterium]|nr:fibronectin type III domain-containing protein [Paludibacteraceae bacterium]